MSLDEWELAEEQYFLMQGLFLVHVPTSCRSFFKARFGSCGITSLQLIETRIVGTARHELPFIHTVLIVVKKQGIWLPWKIKSERDPVPFVLRSHQMQGMQWNHNSSSQLIPTSTSVETSSAKSGNAVYTNEQ